MGAMMGGCMMPKILSLHQYLAANFWTAVGLIMGFLFGMSFLDALMERILTSVQEPLISFATALVQTEL
jgi:hypothetical protein